MNYPKPTKLLMIQSKSKALATGDRQKHLLVCKSSDAMALDISFKKLDLVALKFDDIFDEVANGNNANHLVGFENWQVSDVLVHHDRHALL